MSKDLYNSVKWQNTIIQNQIAQLRATYSTDEQKIKYMIQTMETTVYINFILWCCYYLCCFIVLYFVFFGSQSENSTINYKIFIIFCFFIYPVIITTLEINSYNFFQYIYSLFFASVYTNDSLDRPSFSILNFFPPS